MTLLRQGRRYTAVGLLQLAMDWLVYVGFTALGLPIAPANIAGRFSGMLLGFWLNGRYTFATADGRRLGWRRFSRFFALWLLFTAISTLLISIVENALGLRFTWLAKPLVEGSLALASFLLVRRLVYR